MIFDYLKNLFKTNVQEEDYKGNWIQVELTKEAKESNINDNFNKQIVIYRKGKRARNPIDYSPEDLMAIKEVHPYMPIYFEKLSGDYEMEEEEYFGEVVTR